MIFAFGFGSHFKFLRGGSHCSDNEVPPNTNDDHCFLYPLGSLLFYLGLPVTTLTLGYDPMAMAVQQTDRWKITARFALLSARVMTF